MIKEIGQFSPEIIKLLNLNIAENTPILIGDSNIEHIGIHMNMINTFIESMRLSRNLIMSVSIQKTIP